MPQNALYWLWLTCIADETGGDKLAIHETFKGMYLPRETAKVFLETCMDRPVSTSTLNTAQFTQYLDKIQVFASSELGIVLPLPGDLAFEAFQEYYKDRL